jgi:hypothetical protein
MPPDGQGLRLRAFHGLATNAVIDSTSMIA